MTRTILFIARAMAVLGGIVLTALMLLTCISVLGRGGNTLMHWDAVEAVAPGLSAWLLEAGLGPVGGDFELVEAGIALAIVAFLPLCQVSGGHAAVDIFTNYLPERANRFLAALWEVIFALVLILIAWRLYEGMASKMRYRETTMLLQFPIWWAYGACFAGAAVAALVSVWVACLRVAEMATGRVLLTSEGAGH